MKILLDENLPRKLKADFGTEFEIKTVRDMGWLGKKNGELLELISANNFDIFLTLDKNLQYQQSLEKFNFSVFLLISINNRKETLQKLVTKVKNKIEAENIEKFNIII